MKTVTVKMSNSVRFGPKVCNKIIALVSQFGFIALAAEECGIARGTVYIWMRKGLEDPKGPYGNFAKEITIAKAGFCNKLTKQVSDPKWILARLDAELFSEAAINNVTVNVPARQPLTRDEAIQQLKVLVNSDPDILKALTSGE